MKAKLAKAGFSLVEVMCAIAILGIGIVGLVQGIATALRSSKEAEIQTTAALLASGQMETFRAENFVVEGETEGDGDSGLDNYHWKQTVTATSVDGLYGVTVEVEHSGKPVYELRTLLFDAPLLPSTDNSSKPKDKLREREKRRM